MPGHPVGGWAVVVRRNGKHGVGSLPAGKTRQPCGEPGVVGPGPGDNRNPAADLLAYRRNAPQLFKRRERRRLSRSPAHHKRVGSVADLISRQTLQCPVIHPSVTERRDKCGCRASEQFFSHFDATPFGLKYILRLNFTKNLFSAVEIGGNM